MNMIIGKRQIVLATLVLGLGVAIYLNWEFSKSQEPGSLIKSVDSIKNYGEAEFVKNDLRKNSSSRTIAGEDLEEEKNIAVLSTKSDEYFAQARLNRQKSRDEAIDALKKMLDAGNADQQQKDKLINDAAVLSKTIESEAKIENIIKAKGFSEVMVYIQQEKVTVIVKSKGLKEAQAAQIKDIVITETDVDLENISIVEVK